MEKMCFAVAFLYVNMLAIFMVASSMCTCMPSVNADKINSLIPMTPLYLVAGA